MFNALFPLDKVYTYSYVILPYTSTWKIKSKSKWKNRLYFCYKCFVIFSYLSFITMSFHLAYLGREDRAYLTENLSASMILSIWVIKMYTLSYKMTQVEEIHRSFDDNFGTRLDFSVEEFQVFQEGRKQSNFLLKAMASLFASGCLSQCIYPLLDKGKGKKFLLPIYATETVLSSPFYELIYTYHVFFAINFLLTVYSIEGIHFGFLLRLITHIKVLKLQFKKIERDVSKGDGSFSQEDFPFGEIIRYHQSILR